jgi:hypothetical protein
VDSPSFSNTHGYGASFGTFPDGDAGWAGAGFTDTPDPATLEPADQGTEGA